MTAVFCDRCYSRLPTHGVQCPDYRPPTPTTQETTPMPEHADDHHLPRHLDDVTSTSHDRYTVVIARRPGEPTGLSPEAVRHALVACWPSAVLGAAVVSFSPDLTLSGTEENALVEQETAAWSAPAPGTLHVPEGLAESMDRARAAVTMPVMTSDPRDRPGTVVLIDGQGEWEAFDERYLGDGAGADRAPIRRAAWIARLRVLADLLERSGNATP